MSIKGMREPLNGSVTKRDGSRQPDPDTILFPGSVVSKNTISGLDPRPEPPPILTNPFLYPFSVEHETHTLPSVGVQIR